MCTTPHTIHRHYDQFSTHYQNLWGEHIHHGLWRPGNEGLSKELAADCLVDELWMRSGLPKGAKVLDVGCGVGGTSIRLARLHDVKATGVSLSTKQIEMAKINAAKGGVEANVSFHEGDGEKLLELLPESEQGTFDAVWISEALSHFPNKDRFFAAAGKLLKPGGKWVACDWHRAQVLSPELLNGVIADIIRGMILPTLCTPTEYMELAERHGGIRTIFFEDVSKETAKTW